MGALRAMATMRAKERGQGAEDPGGDGGPRPWFEVADAGVGVAVREQLLITGLIRANRSGTPIRSLTMW